MVYANDLNDPDEQDNATQDNAIQDIASPYEQKAVELQASIQNSNLPNPHKMLAWIDHTLRTQPPEVANQMILDELVHPYMDITQKILGNIKSLQGMAQNVKTE